MKREVFNIIEHDGGITQLLINTPDVKMNILSQQVFHELDGILNELAQLKHTKILFIRSAKPDVFIAGANIEEIQKIRSEISARSLVTQGKKVFDKLSQLPFPTVAVIDGVCLGGGLELALACTYRIITDNPKTQIGLPEVKLGILPGLGGTQRLPRLIGLQAALPMILSGSSIDSRKAKRIHLADAVFHSEYMDQGMQRFAKMVLTHPEKFRKARKYKLMHRLMENNPLGRMIIYRTAYKSIRSKMGTHYPAPLLALDAIRKGYRTNLQAGLRIEGQNFVKLVVSSVSKHLIRLFFTGQSIKKKTYSDSDTKPQKINRPAILGAGVMGGMIAWLFNYRKRPVILKDISWDAIAQGFKACRKTFDYPIKKRKLSHAEMEMRMLQLSGQTNYVGFKKRDLVIEAIPENIRLKKTVLQELELYVNPETIIASNTSALSINEMASVLRNPERFIGMHFFNPVNRMPLVEIIPGKHTSKKVLAASVQLVKDLGKTPIVVKDSPGFLVNRILLPYLNETAFLLGEGAKAERIDAIMRDFGMPMGPVELLDEIGLDTAGKVLQIFVEQLGSRMTTNGLLERILEENKYLGKKNGMGFYRYHKGRNAGYNASIAPFIHEIQYHEHTHTRYIPNKEIRERLVLSLVNEAMRCMEEQLVESAEMLDLAFIYGTGFPAYTGGPMQYAEDYGHGNIRDALQRYQKRFGQRFTPCNTLLNEEHHLPNYKHASRNSIKTRHWQSH